LNSDLGLGFGFGYNVNNHFQLSGLFNWSTRSYNANIVSDDGTTRRASGTLDTSTIAFNATYFLMSSNFTPYVSGGIGSVFVDSNIPSGQGSTACWYDPFYGYVCNSYAETKTYTSVSYTAGLGVRWEMSRQFALQGSYNKLWIDANSTKEFDGWRLDFVFRM
jgi:opacity protein-like surface antigen